MGLLPQVQLLRDISTKALSVCHLTLHPVKCLYFNGPKTSSLHIHLRKSFSFKRDTDSFTSADHSEVKMYFAVWHHLFSDGFSVRPTLTMPYYLLLDYWSPSMTRRKQKQDYYSSR